MQVTSRGCSRAYIICVLWHVWEHVRLLKSQDNPINFPFSDSIVKECLVDAKEDCLQAGEQFLELFGGTDFAGDDSTTFWTIPPHFFTWWKNNIERKSKFAHLIEDAAWKGNEGMKHATRSKYCRQVVALALNIKHHFDRIVNQHQNNPIRQIHLPFEMPSHMRHQPYATIYSYITVDEYLAERLPKVDKSASSSSILSTARTLRTNRKPSKRVKYVESTEEEDNQMSQSDFSEGEDEMNEAEEEEEEETSHREEEAFSTGPKIKKRKYEYLLSTKKPKLNSSPSKQAATNPTKRKRGRPAKSQNNQKFESNPLTTRFPLHHALFGLRDLHHPLDDPPADYGHLIHGRDSDSDDEGHGFVFTFESTDGKIEEIDEEVTSSPIVLKSDTPVSPKRSSPGKPSSEQSTTELEGLLAGKCLVNHQEKFPLQSVNVHVQYIPYDNLPSSLQLAPYHPHHRVYHHSSPPQHHHHQQQLLPRINHSVSGPDSVEFESRDRPMHTNWHHSPHPYYHNQHQHQQHLHHLNQRRSSSSPPDGFMASEVDHRHSPVELSRLSLLTDQQLGLHPTEQNHAFFVPVSMQHLSTLPQLKITTPSLSRSNSLSSHHLSTDRAGSLDLDDRSHSTADILFHATSASNVQPHTHSHYPQHSDYPSTVANSTNHSHHTLANSNDDMSSTTYDDENHTIHINESALQHLKQQQQQQQQQQLRSTSAASTPLTLSARQQTSSNLNFANNYAFEEKYLKEQQYNGQNNQVVGMDEYLHCLLPSSHPDELHVHSKQLKTITRE